MGKTRNKCFAIVLILIIAVANLTVATNADTDWQALGNLYFEKEKIVESAFKVYGDNVYVAYRTVERPNSLVVKELDNNRWDNVGIPLQCDNMTAGLSLDVKNGVPYVAYCQTTKLTDGTYDSKITIKRFINNSWSIYAQQELKGKQTDKIAFQIDKGISYVAYKTVQGMGLAVSNSVTVMKYSGAAWSTVGDAGFISGNLSDIMLCVSNGIPYAASSNRDTNSLKVMKFDGKSWISLGEDVDNGGYQTALDVFGNSPYITYSNSKDRVDVKKFENGAWKDLRNVSEPGQLGVPRLQAGNNVVWLCYAKNDKLFISKYNGTAWETRDTGKSGICAFQLETANNSLYIGYSGRDNLDGSGIGRVIPQFSSK